MKIKKIRVYELDQNGYRWFSFYREVREVLFTGRWKTVVSDGGVSVLFEVYTKPLYHIPFFSKFLSEKSWVLSNDLKIIEEEYEEFINECTNS